MNTIKKHINILLLGCCSLNFISCTDLTEEIFSDITEDSYKYEAGDATKVVGAAYTNLQDWGLRFRTSSNAESRNMYRCRSVPR